MDVLDHAVGRQAVLSEADAPGAQILANLFMGGAIVQWLRDGLGIVQSSSEVEALAASVPDTGGVYLVPAFAGLGAPHWDPYARGTIVGITRGTTRAHLARAVIEAMAYQTRDAVTAMTTAAGVHVQDLRVDGGASVMDEMLQMQSDQLGVPVRRPADQETTALGAAYAAGLAVGYWASPADITANWGEDKRWNPAMDAPRRAALNAKWDKAVARSRDWVD